MFPFVRLERLQPIKCVLFNVLTRHGDPTRPLTTYMSPPGAHTNTPVAAPLSHHPVPSTPGGAQNPQSKADQTRDGDGGGDGTPHSVKGPTPSFPASFASPI